MITNQDMVEFFAKLEEKHGPFKNWRGVDIKPEHYLFICSFGPGWYELTQRLITDLIALGWDRMVCQTKEKFGGLRFYIGDSSPEIRERIDQAEAESFKTCEYCGAPGSRDSNSYWVKTLCAACVKRRHDEDMEV